MTIRWERQKYIVSELGLQWATSWPVFCSQFIVLHWPRQQLSTVRFWHQTNCLPLARCQCLLARRATAIACSLPIPNPCLLAQHRPCFAIAVASARQASSRCRQCDSAPLSPSLQLARLSSCCHHSRRRSYSRRYCRRHCDSQRARLLAPASHPGWHWLGAEIAAWAHTRFLSIY